MPLQRSKLFDWDDLLIPLFVPFLLVGRADPECMLGHLLRILFKNDDFMNAVGLLLTHIVHCGEGKMWQIMHWFVQ